jgi:prephenate dehydrogenase
MLDNPAPHETVPIYRHLTVIGCGLLGGSWLMAAKESNPTLHTRAVDTNAETLQYLLKAHVADDVSLTLPTQWESNHLVIIATHLTASLEVLKQLAPLVQHDPTLTVSDIGSCKRAIVALGQELLPNQFVGGHPLAGKEVSGVQNATSLLFAGKPYVLCPNVANATPAYAQHIANLKHFIETTLRAGVGTQTVDTHDRAMAFVSHLPQLYAVVLTQLLAQNRPAELLAFHGAGMDGHLRLAASPYDMWHDVVLQNADNLKEVIGQCKALLAQLETQLNAIHTTPTEDANALLAQWFTSANTIHQRFHQAKQ